MTLSFNKYNLRESLSTHVARWGQFDTSGSQSRLASNNNSCTLCFSFTRLACYQIGSRGDRSGRRPRSAFDANQGAAAVFNVLLLQLPNLYITSSTGRYSMCYLNKLQGRADWMNVFTLFFLSWRIATLQLTAWWMKSACQKRTTASSMRYSLMVQIEAANSPKKSRTSPSSCCWFYWNIHVETCIKFTGPFKIL